MNEALLARTVAAACRPVPRPRAARRRLRRDLSKLRMMVWFAGCGGDSQGSEAVDNVAVTLAANHSKLALASHASNFPQTDHKVGDIRKLPVHQWPVTELFWASPACTKWSNARGKKRTFNTSRQDPLWDDRTPQQRAEDEAEEQSRALMIEVPQYLEGVQQRGGLVLAGVVENVIDERAWDRFDWWLNSIRKLGYRTRVIAFNSMHAQGTRTPGAPQSRDRLYVAYWHESLGRDPDWDKWLRPRADCPTCGPVNAIQAFKRPGADMGRYHASYVYRCPRVTCRNQVIEPDVLPALTAVNWSIPGTRIGDRPKTPRKPEGLAPATIQRIRAGIRQYWEPMAADDSVGLDVASLLVPVEGRHGKVAQPLSEPARTQTTRNETGLAIAPPFMIPMRGGGDSERARRISAPLHTVSAEGNHHGLTTPPGLMVPYYGTGTARPDPQAVGAMASHDRYGIASSLVPADIDIDDVLFRMLTPDEIARAMAFVPGYTVLGNDRERVRQLGNAVTPPVAEILVSALVEAVTGEPIERNWALAA